jgi:hypothetical protein
MEWTGTNRSSVKIQPLSISSEGVARSGRRPPLEGFLTRAFLHHSVRKGLQVFDPLSRHMSAMGVSSQVDVNETSQDVSVAGLRRMGATHLAASCGLDHKSGTEPANI